MIAKLNVYIIRNGVSYMFPWINAYIFLSFKIIMGLVLAAVSAVKMPVLILPFGVFGFYIPNIIAGISNNSDNDSMLTDIESIYDIMRIQARAGVFIQDSLMDCYMSTKNARLKSALLELCNGIGANSTLEEEVELFRQKFNNRHIDVLCIILSQAQTTGKTVQILSDMSEQIRQVRHTVSLRAEGRLERKIEVLELLIFVGILAIGVYSMGTEILQMMQF